MKFDELNKLESYYKVMEIPESEKKKRVELAQGLFDAFYFILATMKIDKDIDREFYINSLKGRVIDTIGDYHYDPEYVDMITEEVIDTTLRHLDDEYYFSPERALLISQNESNSILNNDDFRVAKEKGFTFKEWVAQMDERTRLEHVEVDHMKIPIDEYFYVGHDRMLFPHDTLNGSAENLINCRCVCHYT